MSDAATTPTPDATHATYREALAWLYSFSDSERTGQFVRDREDNLARARALLATLGDPQRAYGVVHIAGTKGKGSTAAMVAAILQAGGVRAGLYTQPDLHTFRERIRINGQVLTEAEVARLVPLVRAAVAAVGTRLGSFITYEVATALAFLALREAGAAYGVIEVGLGGRLDATNIVEPQVTGITSISYDHMEVLGNTLTAIATEKAGIVKPGVPLVTTARNAEALAAITRICAERSAPLLRVGPADAADAADAATYAYRYTPGEASTEHQAFDLATPHAQYRGLELRLLGEHQIENASAAVALVEQLAVGRGVPLDEAAIRSGLRTAFWPARLQVVGREPWGIVDGAHNADSFARLFAALRRQFPFERLLLVLGLMADKDLPGIAAEVARAGVQHIYATAAQYPRAATPSGVATALRVAMPAAPPPPIDTYAHVSDALTAALQEAGPRDLVCVAGSLYLAGEALRWLAAERADWAHGIEVAGSDH